MKHSMYIPHDHVPVGHRGRENSNFTTHDGGPLIEKGEEEDSRSGETVIGNLLKLQLPQGYSTSWAEN